MPTDAAADGFAVVSESSVAEVAGDRAQFTGHVRQADVLPAQQPEGLRASRGTVRRTV